MYPLRSITFIAELLHGKTSHAVDQLQRVHGRTFEDSATRYTNFQVLQNGGMLANPAPRPDVVSNVTFLPDRVRVQEQKTGISREDFEQRVVAIATIAREELGIGSYLAQQFVVQSLVNPRGGAQCDAFMTDQVLQVEPEAWSPFGRAPDLFGLRLRFPGTGDDPSVHHLRVENYQQDARSLFVEAIGVYRIPAADDCEEILTQAFQRTYDFLQGPAIDLIARFEARGADS